MKAKVAQRNPCTLLMVVSVVITRQIIEENVLLGIKLFQLLCVTSKDAVDLL